ncbi:MAG: hypothetical protein ACK518_02330, partial [bacterium]
DTLFQIERAHLMDPDLVPDLLNKEICTIQNPMKLVQIYSQTYPRIEIPEFSKGKENDIDSILLEKVEGSDLNEDQKEDLLNLVSLSQDIL